MRLIRDLWGYVGSISSGVKQVLYDHDHWKWFATCRALDDHRFLLPSLNGIDFSVDLKPLDLFYDFCRVRLATSDRLVESDHSVFLCRDQPSGSLVRGHWLGTLPVCDSTDGVSLRYLDIFGLGLVLEISFEMLRKLAYQGHGLNLGRLGSESKVTDPEDESFDCNMASRCQHLYFHWRQHFKLRNRGNIGPSFVIIMRSNAAWA